MDRGLQCAEVADTDYGFVKNAFKGRCGAGGGGGQRFTDVGALMAFPEEAKRCH